MPDEQEPVPARVVEAYDQMMRQVIGPGLRQLGFRGTVREFKYGDRGHFGAVRWQKDGRAARAQLMPFTANVDYWCGEDRIGSLMPVPALDTWWVITGGQSYDLVAESVISAVRWYALPAIQAGLEDSQQPRIGYQSGYLGDPDDGGASTSSFFVQPAGSYDEQFASFTEGMPYLRLQAAEIVTSCAASDPRTVPALLDRLSHDPQREIRKMIASRMLCLFTDHPDVIPALQVTAAGDSDTGVRWAARYGLRLANDEEADAALGGARWTKSDAWVLGAIAHDRPPRPHTLTELLSIAHRINHDVMTEAEFTQAIGRLLAAGLIEADPEADRYCPTQTGAKIRERWQHGPFGWMPAIPPQLQRLGEPHDTNWTLQDGAFHRASESS